MVRSVRLPESLWTELEDEAEDSGFAGPADEGSAGKGSHVPDGTVVHPGAEVATDVRTEDYAGAEVAAAQRVETRRLPHQV